MRINTRRVKSQLHELTISIVIFGVTLIVCLIVSSLFIFRQVQLISPLAVSAVHSIDTDKSAALIRALCTQNHLTCASIQAIGNDSVQLTLENGAVVLLSTKKDLSKQLASLQQALSQLTIKGKQLKRLDFRFDSVVVSF